MLALGHLCSGRVAAAQTQTNKYRLAGALLQLVVTLPAKGGGGLPAPLGPLPCFWHHSCKP